MCAHDLAIECVGDLPCIARIDQFVATPRSPQLGGRLVRVATLRDDAAYSVANVGISRRRPEWCDFVAGADRVTAFGAHLGADSAYSVNERSAWVLRRGEDVLIIVPRSPGDTAERLPLRLCREIMLRHEEGQGRFPMHAACVASNGKAVAILGPSGSGKTTLAMALILQCGLDFVGNDYLFIDGESLRVAALPLPVRFGAGTLEAPELRSLRARAGPPRRGAIDTGDRRPASAWGSSLKFEVAPKQLVASLGRTLVPEAKLKLAILADLRPGAQELTMTRLTIQRASKQFEEQFTNVGAFWKRPWLEAARSESISGADRRVLARRLARRVPTYRLAAAPVHLRGLALGPLLARL